MSEAAAASLTAPNAPSAHRRRVGSVTLAGARVVLALFLGFSAVAKLVAHASAVESFDRMGWGSGAMYAIGGLELAGALALLIPLLAGVAAIALVGLLAGASVVQRRCSTPERGHARAARRPGRPHRPGSPGADPGAVRAAPRAGADGPP